MCVLFCFLFGLEEFLFIKTTFTHTVSSRLIIHCVGVGVGVCCLKKVLYTRTKSKKRDKKSPRRERHRRHHHHQKAALEGAREALLRAGFSPLCFSSFSSSSSFTSSSSRFFVDGGRSASSSSSSMRHNTKMLASCTRGCFEKNDDDESFGRRRRGGGGGGGGKSEREQRRRRELRCERETFWVVFGVERRRGRFSPHSKKSSFYAKRLGKSPPRSLQLYEDMVRVGVFGRARDGDENKARGREEGGTAKTEREHQSSTKNSEITSI